MDKPYSPTARTELLLGRPLLKRAKSLKQNKKPGDENVIFVMLMYRSVWLKTEYHSSVNKR